MKYVILLVGTSAVGKSTVRELLVPPPYLNPIQRSDSIKKPGWCYLGTGKAGSETIKTLEVFKAALDLALDAQEITVVDTVRISDAWPSLLKECLKKMLFKIILVHFDIPIGTARDRLRARRKKLNLKPFDCLTAIERQKDYVRSTLNAVSAFAKSNVPYKLIHITSGHFRPEHIAWLITKETK